jgi:hypothetical protein
MLSSLNCFAQDGISWEFDIKFELEGSLQNTPNSNDYQFKNIEFYYNEYFPKMQSRKLEVSGKKYHIHLSWSGAGGGGGGVHDTTKCPDIYVKTNYIRKHTNTNEALAYFTLTPIFFEWAGSGRQHYDLGKLDFHKIIYSNAQIHVSPDGNITYLSGKDRLDRPIAMLMRIK